MTRLESREAFDSLLRAGTALIYKHSSACNISSVVRREVESYASLSGSPDTYEVLVIEQRELSDYVAASTAVPHESPQAILLRDGRVQWHGSHFEIELTALQALDVS